MQRTEFKNMQIISEEVGHNRRAIGYLKRQMEAKVSEIQLLRNRARKIEALLDSAALKFVEAKPNRAGLGDKFKELEKEENQAKKMRAVLMEQ